MGNRLTRYKLGQLVEIKRGQSLAGEFYAEQGNVKRLTLANFDYQNGGFKYDTLKKNIFYTGPVKPDCLLEKGDIITPLTEQTPGLLGSTARIPESNTYVQSGDVALVKCKEYLIDPSFCYYLLPSYQVKSQLAAGAQQTKIRHTNPDAIKNCIVDIPSIEQQKKIGTFLDALTAKIDENNKQYNLLEKIAQHIYNYWFLQFDFPDEDGKPYKFSGGKMARSEELKREIPEGWSSACVGELVAPLQRGISYNSNDIASPDGVPFFNLACFNKQGEYRSGEMKYYSGKFDESDKIHPFDMLIACTDMTQGADIIGRPILATQESDFFLYTMDLAKITPLSVAKMYLYYSLKTPFYHQYIKPFASGTNVKHLDTRGILDYKMVVPPKRIQEQFEVLINPIKRHQMEIINEINYLKECRASVLPILMNGQVSIPEDKTEWDVFKYRLTRKNNNLELYFTTRDALKKAIAGGDEISIDKRKEELLKAAKDLLQGIDIQLVALIGYCLKSNNKQFLKVLKKGEVVYRNVNHSKIYRPIPFDMIVSPPIRFTKNDMRMSFVGDPVFYGSFDKETTIIEAVGLDKESHSYVGKFRLKKDIRILDLTKYKTSNNVCNNAVIDNILSQYCSEISKQVNDEGNDYLPTQLMTYLFRNIVFHHSPDGNKYPIEGIKYSSSKKDSDNIVVFADNAHSSEYFDLVSYERWHKGKKEETVVLENS